MSEKRRQESSARFLGGVSVINLIFSYIHLRFFEDFFHRFDLGRRR